MPKGTEEATKCNLKAKALYAEETSKTTLLEPTRQNLIWCFGRNLTCSNPSQFCLSPSCPPDGQAWPPGGGTPAPGHVSAGRCQPLHTRHKGARGNGRKTGRGHGRRGSQTIDSRRAHVIQHAASRLDHIPFGPRHRSAGQAPGWGPKPGRSDTACVAHTSHSPEEAVTDN